MSPRFAAASILCFALVCTVGCSTIPNTIKELSKDSATACVNLTLSTPWGTQVTKIARASCTNCVVQCEPDGSMKVQAIVPTKGPSF